MVFHAVDADCSLFHSDTTQDEDFEVYDLADLSPQCGRKGDALKFFLAWQFYGTSGLSAKVGQAFERADQLFSLLERNKDFVMVSERPLPCLQVSPPLRVPSSPFSMLYKSMSSLA
jgi:glutamate decarboxylase